MTERCQMFISLLSGEYPPQPGGVGDYSQRLGAALVARGHRVQAVTIDDGRWTLVDVATNQRQRIGGTLPAAWNWRSWRAIDTMLARDRPDVVHIQYQTGAYGMHPAINLLPWHLRRRSKHPRVVVTMHDLLVPYLFPKAGPLRRWVTGRLMRDADAVVVTNAEDYDQVITTYLHTNDQGQSLPAPLVTIPIGSNIPVAPPADYERAAKRAQLGVRAGETLIVYFGLISRSKGLDVLLHALVHLPDTMRLLVIGGAATSAQDRAFAAEIDVQIDALGLRQRVHSTGHVAEAEVSALLLAADVAALPFADGASLRRGSLLAALAHGVPVVTTEFRRQETGDRRQETGDRRQETGDKALPAHLFTFSPFHLSDGEHALLVPPNDAGALAAAIMRLAGDVPLRKRLGAGGQAFARQFSWGGIAAAHEAVYSDKMTR